MLMRDEDLRSDDRVDEPQDEETLHESMQPEEDAIVIQPSEPAEPAPPITSRFLFVNVAGLRARQLRLGAKSRLEREESDRLGSSKAERVAMEEVRRGRVYWDMPEWRSAPELEVAPAPKRRGARKSA